MTKLGRVMVAVAVFAGLIAIGSPSSAGGTGCPDRKLCLYEHNDLLGWRLEIGGKPRVVNLKAGYTNESSSLHNNRGKAVFIYDGRNARGGRVCILGETVVTDIGGSYGMNDQVSSVKLTTRSSCPAP